MLVFNSSMWIVRIGQDLLPVAFEAGTTFVALEFIRSAHVGEVSDLVIGAGSGAAIHVVVGVGDLAALNGAGEDGSGLQICITGELIWCCRRSRGIHIGNWRGEDGKGKEEESGREGELHIERED